MSRPKSPAWASTFTSNLISSWSHDPTVPPTTSFQFPICSNHLRTLGHHACCSLCWNTLPPSSPGLVQLLILTAQIWQDSPVLCSYSLLHFSVGWEWPSRKLFQAFCGLDRYWSTPDISIIWGLLTSQTDAGCAQTNHIRMSGLGPHFSVWASSPRDFNT